MKRNILDTAIQVLSYFGAVITAALILLFINTFIILNARVPSGSMEPTLQKQCRIVGYRMAYEKESPQRYDVIIFRYPDDNEKRFIKRIIGLPGDRIDIRDGSVYVNEKKTDEDFCMMPSSTDGGNLHYPFTVPRNSYFVLGDNRKKSNDSRYWNDHFVYIGEIEAKALIIYYPFYDFGIIH